MTESAHLYVEGDRQKECSMVKLDCGRGYWAVPLDTVESNGSYVESLNEGRNFHTGGWPLALLNQEGQATMDFETGLPRKYYLVEDCKAEVENLMAIKSGSMDQGDIAIQIDRQLKALMVTVDHLNEVRRALALLDRRSGDLVVSMIKSAQNKISAQLATTLTNLVEPIWGELPDSVRLACRDAGFNGRKGESF